MKQIGFVANAKEVARSAMESIRPDLADRYVLLVSFLVRQPEVAAALRGSRAPEVGSADYIRRQAAVFAASREARAPAAPTTVPDEVVSIILREYFEIPEADLERAKREHLLSMGAENLVGELLERYLAVVLEPLGWIWCSGSMVRAVDFVKPPGPGDFDWRLLQVKNRDNSENSSSSAIRDRTSIEKWYRTFSRRDGSNWDAFPDPALRALLSEIAFRDFVRKYLRDLLARSRPT